MKRLALFLLALLALGISADGGVRAASATAPINGRIVFDSSRAPGDSSSHMLYSIAPDGSDLQGPLTPTFVANCSACLDAEQPVFSPDGTKVAYHTTNFAGRGEAIGIINPDGTDRHYLVGHDETGCNLNREPAWSPDGQHVVFVTCTGAPLAALGIVGVDGTGFRFLLQTTQSFGAVGRPSWSPDGTKIAYERIADNGEAHIFTISPDGTGETDLGVVGFDPAWSPDGTKIAFHRPNGGGDNGIWVMNADGTNPVRLTTAIDVEPAWSPDGTKIVYAHATPVGEDLYTMDADGGNQRLLADGTGAGNFWPTWGRVPSQDVVVTDCNDPRLTQLTSVPGDLVIQVPPDCPSVDLSNVVSVGGNLSLTVAGSTAINLGNVINVGGNVTFTVAGSATINLGNVVNVGGNVTLTEAGSTAINLGSDVQTAGGNLTIAGSVDITSTNPDAVTTLAPNTHVDGNADVETTGPSVGLGGVSVDGDLSLTGNGSNTVAAQTAGVTTEVKILGGVAAMDVLVPHGAFTQPVPFTIERQGDAPPAPGTFTDGTPATIDPLAGYHFSFAVPTLNQDAQLSFTIDLARLDADTRAALLAGVQGGSATIAVQGDAPGSAYQAFPRCGVGQTPAANGCVAATLLDAAGQPTQDPTSAASVRFEGIAGHFSSYAVVLAAPLDSTPPRITPTVTGTLGGDGFYTSDVHVSWTVEDPESAISAQSGCDAATVTADTLGTTFTCTATSAGGTDSKSVTVKRDATPPLVSYSGNAGTYTVDQSVTISCTATDLSPGSGLASSTCADASGPAYAFGLGSHTLAATAADKAGNSGSGSTTFTVVVTPGSLCRLTYAFVQGSDAYKRLSATLRATIDAGVANLCTLVDQIVPGLSPTQKALLVAAYKRGLQGLVLFGYLTSAQATTLGALADAL